jgi:hypothetical protein
MAPIKKTNEQVWVRNGKIHTIVSIKFGW